MTMEDQVKTREQLESELAVARESIALLEIKASEFVQITETLETARQEAVNERNRLEAVMQALPVGVAILDRQGGIIHLNSTYREIWGDPEPSAKDIDDYEKFKAWWIDTGGLVRPEEWASAQAVSKGVTVVDQEMEIESFDGTRKFVLNSAAPVFDSNHKVIGSAVAIQDITRHRNSEAEIIHRAAELEAVFQAQNDVILIYDTGMNVLRANPSFLSTYGFDPVGLNVRDIIKRTSCRLLDGNPLILDDQPTPRALRGERTTGSYFLVTREDGSDMVVETTSGPMLEGDRITGSVTVWHDITELNRVRESLQLSEARFRLLSETAGRLLASEDPQKIVEDLCTKVMEYLDCQVFFNFLADEHAGRLRLNACSGIREEDARAIEWLDYGIAICGCAAQQGSRIIVEDILGSEEPRAELVKSMGVQAYCCHPLIAGGKTIGTLSFGTRTRTSFSTDEITVMKTVADQVAITIERIRIMNDLDVNLAKFRVLFESFPLGISITDRDGKIIESNRESERLLGLSKDEHEKRVITGDKWKIIRTDGTDMPDDEYASVIALKEGCLVENVEMGIVKGHKDVTWINVTAAPIPLEGYGIVITYGDITKRRMMEEVLRKSEGRYQELFNVMNEGFALHEIICDDTGRPCDYRFLDMNPAFERLTGFRREEVLDRTVTEILPQEASQWIEIYGPVALEGEPVHLESYSPGLQRYFEIFCYRPTLGQFAVMFMDITQRKKSEEKLLIYQDELEKMIFERTVELEDRNRQLIDEIAEREKIEHTLRIAGDYNRSLIEASLDTLVTIDADGRITDVNRATEKVTGYTRVELIGTDFSDYFTEPDFARAVYKKVFNDGLVQDYPLNIRHRDGKTTPVLYNAAVYHDQARKVLGVFAAARDISRLKKAEGDASRLEAELLKAQRMEALGKLAGGIAHDFNNVIQPILINSELLMDMVQPESLERQYLREIIDAALLGRNLITQIKMFGSGKNSPLKTIFLCPVVKDAIAMMKRTIPPRIKLRQWVPSADYCVNADPTQIHQLILNLSNNAVQAMHTGEGFIGVSLKETAISSYTQAHVADLNPGKYLKLTIRDTGAGISPDIMEKIFDPFFTTRHSGKGTGLGLAVVYEVVKNMNGSIIVNSEVGKGTRFDIYMPLHKILMAQVPQQMKEPAGLGTGHVLLADDNIGDLNSIHHLLQHLGYRVTSSSDPGEALNLFRNEPDTFTLVVTDQVMPRMRGHELAAQVRLIKEDIPIVICSGSEECLRELQGRDLSRTELLHKPFSRSQLKDAIRRALDSGSFTSS